MTAPQPTAVFNTYWKFAAKRLAMYLARLQNPNAPCTDDPILAAHRFTNTYRASDRVSQYLIRHVQYDPARSQAPSELLFRTLLFKTFNKIETWEALEQHLGTISWQSADLAAMDAFLDQLISKGYSIYSAAYIMPAPPMGRIRKHSNHLMLIDQMMQDGLAGKICAASSLDEIYQLLLAYPGLGRFLAFQYAIDINYSTLTNFDEDQFVVAGPGAIDGLSKCFENAASLNPEDTIRWTSERQDQEFARLGLTFPGLFGRRLRLIDLQNCYCEISKYARVAHPDVPGVSGRTRIKQVYRAARQPLPQPFFPPKWNLHPPAYAEQKLAPPIQGDLFG